MRKSDFVLIAIAVMMVISLMVRFLSGLWFLKLLVGIYTIVMLIYWKLSPYKTQLSTQYIKWFNYAERIIQPIWNLFKKLPKIQLGQHLAMDVAPFIICCILIILLIVL